MANEFFIQSRTAFILIGLLGLAACATGPEISTHVPNGVRLEQYKTYKLNPGEVHDAESGMASDLAEVRLALEADVREELERRGLKSQDHNPDLVFSYAAARRLLHWGEKRWPYHEGGIDLSARDTAGRTVWSSHIQGMIVPGDKTHRRLKEAIGRAFNNYPSISQ